MKRYALIAALLLAGCGPTTPSIDTAALRVVINKIVGLTKQICSFVPTDATITAIIASMGPEAASAQVIAQSICTAVLAADTEGDDKVSCPMVAGVCVEGAFVPKEAEPAPPLN